MALDFPASPSNGQLFTDPQGTTWKWDGVKWTAATVGNYVPLSGGTMSGALILSGDPTTPLGAATKQYVDSGPASHNVGRNLIHNSLFNVAQRGAGPWTTFSSYTLDRWRTNGSTDAVSFIQAPISDSERAQIGDEAAQSALQNTFTGNAAAGAYNSIYQPIERVSRLSGKTALLSFWAIASVPLQLGVNAAQVFGTGGSPSASVNVLATGIAVPATATWARHVVAIPMPSIAGQTLGTNGDDFTQIRIAFSSGANANQLFGNIGVQSGTVKLWGVQLEIAQPGQTQPTPVEKPDPRYDLANCQRFYQTGQSSFYGYGAASNTIGTTSLFPVTMRAAPTITFVTPGYNNASGVAAAFVSAAVIGAQATVTAVGIAAFASSWTASADL